MLFDLRSRGRRRTVQGVYLTLAVLMGGGLVLFGVGAGNGIGGLLNAFTGNSNSSNKPAVSQAEKSALHQTQLNPNSASAWGALVQARYEAAGQDQNQTTGAFTSAGLQKLRQAGDAWQRYLKLTKKPDSTVALLAAHAYDSLGDVKHGVGAWQAVTQANPTAFTYYEYLAADAWQAKQIDLGDLASQKAISLAPKAQRLQVKSQLAQIKSKATGSPATTGGASTSGATTTTPGH
jgi:tetratricopeptide (TPR) repeat protein